MSDIYHLSRARANTPQAILKTQEIASAGTPERPIDGSSVIVFSSSVDGMEGADESAGLCVEPFSRAIWGFGAELCVVVDESRETTNEELKRARTVRLFFQKRTIDRSIVKPNWK